MTHKAQSTHITISIRQVACRKRTRAVRFFHFLAARDFSPEVETPRRVRVGLAFDSVTLDAHSVRMNDAIPCRSLEDLVKEGEKLLKGRPYCHKMMNDQTAMVFILQMQQRGLPISVSDAEACLRRMRIAIDTGIYPDNLLRQASPRYF